MLLSKCERYQENSPNRAGDGCSDLRSCWTLAPRAHPQSPRYQRLRGIALLLDRRPGAGAIRLPGFDGIAGRLLRPQQPETQPVGIGRADDRIQPLALVGRGPVLGNQLKGRRTKKLNKPWFVPPL